MNLCQKLAIFSTLTTPMAKEITRRLVIISLNSSTPAHFSKIILDIIRK